MPYMTVTVEHPTGGDPQFSSTMKGRDALRRAISFLYGALGGSYAATKVEVGSTEATGTLTIESGSGSVGGTINGTAVTVTWATSDTASAAALAVAINAAADIVSKHVVATSSAGVVTLTAKCGGHAGNAVTLVASGTGVTASGARLTGGSGTVHTF